MALTSTVRRDADARVIRFAEELGVELCYAIGIVESMHLWSNAYISKGMIGKYSDEIIAESIGYSGDSGRMVGALIASGWATDLKPECRLVLVGRSWKKGNKKTRRWDRMKRAGGDIRPHVRRLVLERDKCCLSCGTTEDLTIDHIIPVSLDGTNEITNLQVLCRRCNGRKRDYMPECANG